MSITYGIFIMTGIQLSRGSVARFKKIRTFIRNLFYLRLSYDNSYVLFTKVKMLW